MQAPLSEATAPNPEAGSDRLPASLHLVKHDLIAHKLTRMRNKLCLSDEFRRQKAQQFLDQANAAIAPSTVAITVNWRSSAEQAVAKANGLSNAGPDESPHNCCMADGTPAAKAFDWAVFNPDGSYVTDGKDPRYSACGAIVQGLGLTWGGSWIHPDFDHAEMIDWRDS